MSIWRPVVECTDPAQLDRLQSRRFRESMQRMAAVPFYQQRLQAAGIEGVASLSLADLPHLPFTRRQELYAQSPLSMLAVPRSQIARLHATGGAQPLLIPLTRRDLATWADIAARSLMAAGCRAGETWYLAATPGLLHSGLAPQQGAELIGAAVLVTGRDQPEQMLRLLEALPPVGIHCTPGYLLRLGQALQESGRDPAQIGLRHALLGGEACPSERQDLLESLFNAKAFDVYGPAEFFGSGIAYECEAEGGLHISEDHFILEIIDPETGLPLPPGQCGEVVLTTLTQEAMPLLRYRTGEHSRLLEGGCVCGRTTRRLARRPAAREQEEA